MALRLRSKVFQAFQEIPVRYTSDERNLSPPLKWSGVPEGTREFVLMCEDPDAPLPRPFVHWIIYGISPNVSQLPEGLPAQERIDYPVLAHQGVNSSRAVGYTGPRPPFWHGPHHYHFKLYALDSELGVPPHAGREQILKAMKGHVIEQATLVGIYERKVRKKVRDLVVRAEPAGGWRPLGLLAAGGALSVLLFRWLESGRMDAPPAGR